MKTLAKSRGVELYGGAMSIELPETFRNAAEFRQIPDHQEVFVDHETENSIIIEILERSKESDISQYFPLLFRL